MRIALNTTIVSYCLVAALVGCGPSQTTQPTNTTPKENEPHSHDDVLYWQSENDEHEGYVMQLGHHGTHVFAAHSVEPAVSIEKDGESSSDVKVFVAMLDSATSNVVGEEAAMTYEAKTEEEPAHFAQAKFDVPKDVKSVDFRYRIEFPGDVAEFKKTVTVPVDSH